MAKRLVPGVAGDRWAGEDEEDDVKVRPGGPSPGPRGVGWPHDRPRRPAAARGRRGAGRARLRPLPYGAACAGDAGPRRRGPARGRGGPGGG